MLRFDNTVSVGGAPGRDGDVIRVPLLWSAAGHILVLSACVVFGMAAGGRDLPVFVQVVLVEGFPAADRVFPPTPDTAVATPLTAATGIPPAVVPAAVTKGPAAAAPDSVPLETPGKKAEIAGAGPTVGGTDVEGKAQRLAPQAGPSAGMAFSGLPPAGRGGGGDRDDPQVRLLRDRIEARIVYPEEAVRKGQEGEVLLRIRIGEGGIPKEVRVARSSGARILDEAARTGVVRAVPLPSIPGWFEVPVRFLLR